MTRSDVRRVRGLMDTEAADLRTLADSPDAPPEMKLLATVALRLNEAVSDLVRELDELRIQGELQTSENNSQAALEVA